MSNKTIFLVCDDESNPVCAFDREYLANAYMEILKKREPGYYFILWLVLNPPFRRDE